MKAEFQVRMITRVGVVLMIALCVLGVATQKGLRWDFANFYDAGHKALVGQIDDLYDPQSDIEGRPSLGRMSFVSPPLTAFLYAPLARFEPVTAFVAFKIENALALLSALGLLFVHMRRYCRGKPEGGKRYAAIFVVLALAYQPFWTVFAVGGQTTPTVLLLLVCGLLAHVSGRFGASALCLVTAVWIKPVLAPGVLFLGLVSGRRFFVATAVLSVLVAVASVAFLGWDIHRLFLARVVEQSGAPETWVYNSALSVWLEPLAVPPSSADASLLSSQWVSVASVGLRLAALAVLARVYVGVLRLTQNRSARRHAEYLLAITGSLLISPVVWEHYLSFLFIPLAYLLAVRDSLSGAARGLIVAIFIMALGQNIVFMVALKDAAVFGSVAGASAIGMFKSAPLLLITYLFWRYREEFLASYREAA